ncbi:uncharacterized protein (TIGR02118 family) [Aminobacter lissarensis]|uniref:Uncharacterized protein (TIGR02118 family) n=1 Tax=Aminobacter carboxidus TaxID=376165 RepID=A0A8E1WHM1_9HYPH|nr:EthD family reductase [Aminobacter lissarensis]MBB6469096.1 uncharacterized protein (TIGR02118 family) [Aminobacter lissarensis]
MFKRMTLLGRLPEQTREQFQRHWVEVHGRLVMQLPEIRRYVQNDILKAWPETEYSGVVELWFDNHADLMNAFGSPAGRSLPADEANFIGGKIVCDVEETIVVPIRNTWASKLISVVSTGGESSAITWPSWHGKMRAFASDDGVVGIASHRIVVMDKVGYAKAGALTPVFFNVFYLDHSVDVTSFAASDALNDLERSEMGDRASFTRLAVSARELLTNQS